VAEVESNKPQSYFEFDKLTLNSHNFCANSLSLAKEVGLALLLSVKYSPDIPFTCGCNAR
jgi:hypothetical protein